ncbi:MAG: glutamate--tRNA ligase family protein [Nibricoccus sp.]
MSKRRLIQLVQEKLVTGWDDPRMPTFSGIRRRGVPASALRRFVMGIGVTRFDALTDIAVFEHAIREELNPIAQRRLAVLKPGQTRPHQYRRRQVIECLRPPTIRRTKTPTTRTVALTREVFIEDDDFAEVPPPKYFRLKPGGEVRLKYACIIKCDEIVKDAAGKIIELRCTADLTTRSRRPQLRPQGQGHHPLGQRRRTASRPKSVSTTASSPWPSPAPTKISRSTSTRIPSKSSPPSSNLRWPPQQPDERYQFERLGYFTLDAKDTAAGKPVFNRTITLKDAWAPAKK